MRMYSALSTILVLTLGTLLFATGVAIAGNEAFLSEVEDMPLMEGLSESLDAGMMFDKPDGRIVVAIAEGNVSKTDVRAFYVGTLPQLGWDPIEVPALGALAFQRDGERLEIIAEDSAASSRHTFIKVHFTIEPE